MQFAVLGANETLLPLLRAAVAEGHRCVATAGLGRWAGQVAAVAPGAAGDAPWELLIGQPPVMLDGETSVDAVVLSLDLAAGGEDREQRAEQLRKLAAGGMPVMAVTPACEGIVGYELDMIRRDNQVALFPFSPLVCHEGAARLTRLIAEPDANLIGEIDQLVLQRAAPFETDTQRLEVFAQDTHLLDRLLGGLQQVSASSSREDTLEQLAAHVQGGRAVARWSLLRGPRQELTVTLLGSRGRVEWTVCDSPLSEHAEGYGQGTWQAGGESSPLTDDGARRAWQLFETRIQGRAADWLNPWDGACRAAEVADQTPRSVQRGRAVALQEQTPTEEDTFKGMMAAGSCGLLLLVLLIFVVWGVIESVRFPSQRSRFLQEREAALREGRPLPVVQRAPFWRRIWPVYPLALLLALQLLRLAFPSNATRTTADNSAPAPSHSNDPPDDPAV